MKPQQQKTYQNNKHFNKPKHDGPPPFDIMLRQFKKKCERKGIVQEVRDRQYYEKPAQAKQRKMKEAVRRERMLQSAQNPYMGRSRKY